MRSRPFSCAAIAASSHGSISINNFKVRSITMNLWSKYKEMPEPAKASIWYVVCDVIQKGLLVLTIPIFTRIMTTAEYGLTNVYSSWMAIIVIFATFNLQYGTFNTAMVEFEDDRDRFVSSMQGLVTTSVTVVFLIYLLGHSLIDDVTKLSMPLFAAMALQMLSNAVFGFWSGKKRFDYLYREVIAATLISAVLTTVVSIALVAMAQSNRGEVKIISTVLVQVAVFAPIYFIVFKRGRTFFDKRYWKFALSMNIALVPYYLAQALFNNSDLLMIEWICGMGDAGLYGTAFSLGTIMAFVINAINNSFVPWKYQQIKAQESGRVSSVASGIGALVAVLLALFMLLGPEVMRVLAAPAYFDARWVIPPVAVSMFFLFFVQQFVDIEFLLKSRLMLVAGSMLAAVSNIVLNALLLPVFGYLVAAYTTLASYILFVVCNYFAARRAIWVSRADYRISDLCNIKIMTIMGVGLIGFSVVCDALYLFDPVRYAVVLLFFAIAFLKRAQIERVLKSFR